MCMWARSRATFRTPQPNPLRWNPLETGGTGRSLSHGCPTGACPAGRRSGVSRMDIAAIVISLVAAATALYAVIHSKRSADAATEAVAIERERRSDEKRDRELSAVPELSAGEHDGAVWRVDGSSLVGVIANRGPGVATIHGVSFVPGPFPRSDGEWDRNQAVLNQGGVLPIDFRWRPFRTRSTSSLSCAT
jgi:hypothetical protein